MSSILIERPVRDESCSHAVSFVSSLKAKVAKWSERQHYSHEEWDAEGFVYFAVIGDPYPTHVKVGFTTNDPEKRVRGMQTGCPFKIRLLGYVFGTQYREDELHCVLEYYRGLGEWFEYSDYVARVIEGELSAEPVE